MANRLKHPPDDNRATNVVPFSVPASNPEYEPLLTYAERREFREMLAYYRATRPKLEAVFTGCPVARRIVEDD